MNSNDKRDNFDELEKIKHPKNRLVTTAIICLVLGGAMFGLSWLFQNDFFVFAGTLLCLTVVILVIAAGIISYNNELEIIEHPRTSRWAIAAIICLVLGWVMFGLGWIFLNYFFAFSSPILCLIAAIMGIVARIIIHFRKKKLKGIIIAYIVILYGLGMFYYNFSSELLREVNAEYNRTHSVQYNIITLGKAIVEYAKHNDGLLPNANQWYDVLLAHNKKISKDTFKNPKVQSGEYSCAFNKYLSGLKLNDIPGDVVLLFEARGNWNLSGSAYLLEEMRKDDYYIIVLFVDGNVGEYNYENGLVQGHNKDTEAGFTRRLRWKP